MRDAGSADKGAPVEKLELSSRGDIYSNLPRTNDPMHDLLPSLVLSAHSCLKNSDLRTTTKNY